MNSKDIGILLAEGEGLRVEFKSSFDNKVIETLVAFANTSGGSVLIGISDDRKVSGVTINHESAQNWLNEIKNKTSPALVPVVESLEYDGRVVFKKRINVTKDVTKDVTKERREFILTLINDNSEVTISELAAICGVSTRSIIRDIEHLKTEKLLRRTGGRKSGYWVIMGDH